MIESRLKKLCEQEGIGFIQRLDNLLVDVTRLPYKKVFSGFFRHWYASLDRTSVPAPEGIVTPKIAEPTVEQTVQSLRYEVTKHWSIEGLQGRLRGFDFGSYDSNRNRLDIDNSSRLSPYIRFGVLSLRELCKMAIDKAGKDCQFIKELACKTYCQSL